MYGNDTIDPVVKYYDQVFAVTRSNDIQWYVDSALANGGPVLDLACGTGRIALALAQAGLEVTAVDQSEGMLDVFRRKLALEEASIQHSIRIEHVAMQSLELPGRFATKGLPGCAIDATMTLVAKRQRAVRFSQSPRLQTASPSSVSGSLNVRVLLFSS